MGIYAGDPRNGPQVSKFAMDAERRRQHDALTAAMHEHEPDVPCLNVSGAYAPDWLAEDPEGQTEAARLCRSCPVLGQCRAYGMRYHEQGVWGGLTKGQRSKHGGEYRRQLEAEAAATAAAAERTAATEQEAAAARQQTGQETDHGSGSSSNTRGLATTGEQGKQLRARNRARRSGFQLEQSDRGSNQGESRTRRGREDPAAAGRRRMKTISCNDERQALADVQQRSGMDGPKRTVKPGETNTRPRNTSQVGIRSLDLGGERRRSRVGNPADNTSECPEPLGRAMRGRDGSGM